MTEPAVLSLCLVTLHYYPAITGAAERFRRYAPGLLKRGVRMSVVTAGAARVPVLEEVDGFQVRRIPVTDGSRSERRACLIRRFVGLVGDVMPRPDVVHLLSFGTRSVPALLGLRWRGMPLVTSITQIPYAREIDARSPVNILREWTRCLPCDRAIAGNEAVAAQASHWIGHTRLVVIPNGVDTARFTPAGSPAVKADLRTRCGLPQGKMLLFVGFMELRKGFDRLMRAWPTIARHCTDAFLVVIAPPFRLGGIEMDAADKALVREFAVFSTQDSSLGRVVLLQNVPRLEDYYRAADVFVFPSRLEGTPNVVAEAMSTALPCVLTPFAGLASDFGRPGQHYVLADTQPELLADSVVSLLKNEDRSRSVGEEARRLVADNLGVERSLDLYAGLYCSLVAGRRPTD